MRFTIIYISIILCINLNAQNETDKYIVKGTVMDSYNNPIENVNIKYKNTGTITDKEGKYKLEIIKNKNIKINASHISYKNYNFSIDFSEKNIVIYDIILEATDN